MQTMFLFRPAALVGAVLAGLALAVGIISAQLPSAGVVTGRVEDPNTHRYLEGVLVQVANTNLRTSTNPAGEYVLTGVPAGPQTITFSYLGYEPVSRSVDIVPGTRRALDIVLGGEIVQLEAVLVESQVVGQAKATNKQRAADTLKNIVAADALGQFPDQNVAESLGRLPGLSLADDQGEARFVLIRGVQHLNNVTVNGVSLPAPEDTIRQMALDVVPSDLVTGLEVTKSATPDMPGNGVGGSLDIQTASPSDRKGLFVAGRFEGSYNRLSEQWSPKVGLTLSNTFSLFGGEDNLAIHLGASWHDRQFSSDGMENGPTQTNKTDPATGLNPVYVRNLTLRNFDVTRERSGFTFNADYRPSAATKVYVRSLISNFESNERRDQMDLRYDGASTVVRLTEHEGEFNNLRNVDRATQEQVQQQIVRSVNAGVDHQLGDWFVNYNLAWSTSIEDLAPDLEISFVRGINFNSSYTYAEGGRPSRIVVTGPNGVADFLDAANYRLSSVNDFSRYKKNETLTARLDARRDFSLRGSPAYLKAGLNLAWADVYSDQEDVTYNWAGPATPLSTMQGAPLDYALYAFGPVMDYDRVRTFWRENRGPGRFVADPLSAARNAGASDYRGTENVFAGYGMGKIDLGKLRLIAGVRVEQTEVDLSGNDVILAGGVFSHLRPIANSRRYSNVLPSVHGRYNATDRLVFRAAWSNTVSRPVLSDIAPRRELQLEGRNPTANVSNPDLKPFESMNYDVSAEYYMARLGLVSLGLFYKDIENTSFNADTLETFDGVPDVSVRRKINGPKAKLYGAELNYQQQLKFLPSPFNGLLWGVNYTRSNSAQDVRINAARGIERQRLSRHSKHVGSTFIGYEKYGLSARASVLYRSAAMRAFREPGLDRINPDYLRYDASVSYRLHRRLKLYAEFTNLADEPFFEYFGTLKGSQRLPFIYQEYDWNANLGVKWEL